MTDLAKTLGVQFKDPQLLATALTHRSFLNENKSVKQSNERLEFLGDSILQLIASDRLYHQFPDQPEGKLTSLRASLVRAKSLAHAAQKIDLGAHLLMSRGEEKSGGRANPSLLADTFEAVIGAIYLDQGLDAVQAFLDKTLLSSHLLKEEGSSDDFKSQLQEKVQEKRRVSPTYKVLSETGPDHNKTFSVGVYIQKELLATSNGKSKQEAEQNAAQIALDKIKR